MSHDAVAAAPTAPAAPSDVGQPLGRGRVITIVLALLLAAALAVLAFQGLVVRESYQFARAYGVPVEVALPDSCVEISNLSQGTRGQFTDCVGTWEVDGEQVEGRLFAGPVELRDPDHLGSLRSEPVDAYAYGSKAFTDGYGEVRPQDNIQLGLVPVWLFIPLPVTVIVLLKVYGKRIKRWANTP